MAAVKLQHPDLAQHQAGVMLQMREFWMECHLCDVVLKSRDGTEHRAHSALLSATSIVLKTLLGGSFCEAGQVQRGQPIEICASAASVVALLDYIYGGQPEVPLEESIELLGLSDAYNLPHLSKAIEVGLRASLENAPEATALKVLQESQGLDDLKDACEDKVVQNFEACVQHPDFLQLAPTQLGQILQRDDLHVSREDVVLQGIFKWINHSADRDASLGLLLLHVDFPSISFENLNRIGHFAGSLGPRGGELQRGVRKALQVHRKRSNGETACQIQPKRRRLQHWSPLLGGTEGAPRKVLSKAGESLRWHEDSMYAIVKDMVNGPSRVLRWKPGECDPQIVAGEGASMAGVNDLGSNCKMFVSFASEIFVADYANTRLLSFRNGSGQVVQAQMPGSVFVTSNGAVYMTSRDQTALLKLIGTTFQSVTDQLPFAVYSFFVTQEEVMYFFTRSQGRFFRISPGEQEPVVVGEVTGGPAADIRTFFVTEGGKIYASDVLQKKVWAFHPGDTTCIEVLQCPEEFNPCGIMVQDRLLYVGMFKFEDRSIVGATYEYVLPPELHLQK